MSVPGKEPAFDGEADTVLAYFRATSSTLARFRSYLVAVGMVAMIWFAIGLALLLGRAEGRPPWRSSVAAASALAFVGLVLDAPGGGGAASYRAGRGRVVVVAEFAVITFGPQDVADPRRSLGDPLWAPPRRSDRRRESARPAS